MNRRELIVAVILGAFFVVGFIGHSLPVTLPWMLGMTPYTLLACGVDTLLLGRAAGALYDALSKKL